MKALYRDKEWLREKYQKDGLSSTQIAQICECDRTTVSKWLKRFGIPRRSMSEISRRRWENGICGGKEYREKMSASLVVYNAEHSRSKEWRENMSLCLAQMWEDGRLGNTAWRRKLSESTKERWERGDFDAPEILAAKSESAKRLWQDPEYRARMSAIQSESTRRRWQHGDFDGVFCSPTSIEIEVAVALDQLGIEHYSQHRPDGCTQVFDEFVPPRLFIEVHGDYWHAYPGKYSSPDRIQSKNLEYDERKARWAIQHGYDLVIIWEHEIKEGGAFSILKERIP